MVRIFLAVALAGCASHASTGPAWPKPEAGEADGGESLAPHVAHGTTAAAAKDPPSTDAPATSPAAAGSDSSPAADTDGSDDPSASDATDDSVTSDEIVIDVGD